MVHRIGLASLAVVVASVVMVGSAIAEDRAGVVTAATGVVTVSRHSTAPVALKFRDDVFLRDRITTAERSIARILLGGKAVLTVAERSNVTVIETPRSSTIDVATGRIALAVAKPLMKPGESIEIRTPTAIAGIRGTVLIVEVGNDGSRSGPTSRISVLKGIVEVQGLSTSTLQPAGPIVRLMPFDAVAVDRVGPSAVERLSPADARRLTSGFTLPVAAGAPATKAAATGAEMRQAVLDADAALGRGDADRRGRGNAAQRGRTGNASNNGRGSSSGDDASGGDSVSAVGDSSAAPSPGDGSGPGNSSNSPSPVVASTPVGAPSAPAASPAGPPAPTPSGLPSAPAGNAGGPKIAPPPPPIVVSTKPDIPTVIPAAVSNGSNGKSTGVGAQGRGINGGNHGR